MTALDEIEPVERRWNSGKKKTPKIERGCAWKLCEDQQLAGTPWCPAHLYLVVKAGFTNPARVPEEALAAAGMPSPSFWVVVPPEPQEDSRPWFRLGWW